MTIRLMLHVEPIMDKIKPDYRIIVAGGREFNKYRLLEKTLNKLLKEKSKTHNIIIVSGTAKGADTLGETYATRKKYQIEQFRANWNKYGNFAGILRNEDIAKVANACVCFWDGKSTGTKSMIELAKKYKLQVRVVIYDPYELLECSSKGYTKLSALFAKVTIFGKTQSIEKHYQLSKRFRGEEPPTNWLDVKGRSDIGYLQIGEIQLHPTWLFQWYHLLWLIYLDQHPEIVEYASQFKDYNDMFRGKIEEKPEWLRSCQADSIRIYIKQGRSALYNECKDIIEFLGVDING